MSRSSRTGLSTPRSNRTNWLASRSAQRRADRVGSHLRAAAIQVTVDADGRLDGLMAEMLLDDRQRHTGRDHPRRTRMAQIVHPWTLRQPSRQGPLAARLPATVKELLGANRIARAVGEQKTGRGEVNDLQRRAGKLMVRIDFFVLGGPICGR